MELFVFIVGIAYGFGAFVRALCIIGGVRYPRTVEVSLAVDFIQFLAGLTIGGWAWYLLESTPTVS